VLRPVDPFYEDTSHSGPLSCGDFSARALGGEFVSRRPSGHQFRLGRRNIAADGAHWPKPRSGQDLDYCCLNDRLDRFSNDSYSATMRIAGLAYASVLSRIRLVSIVSCPI
jgi:hypothetical protein